MYMNPKPGVYGIVAEYKSPDKNFVSRKMYIGSSSNDINQRCYHHAYQLKKGEFTHKELQQHYNRSLYDSNFTIYFIPIIEFEVGEKTKEEIMQYERKMVYAFQSYKDDFGFNTKYTPPSELLTS